MRKNALRLLKTGNYDLAFNAGRTGFDDDILFEYEGKKLTSREVAKRFERAMRWAELRKLSGGRNLIVVYLHGQRTFDDMAAVARMQWFREAVEEGDRHVGCIEWDEFLKAYKAPRAHKSDWTRKTVERYLDEDASGATKDWIADALLIVNSGLKPEHMAEDLIAMTRDLNCALKKDGGGRVVVPRALAEAIVRDRMDGANPPGFVSGLCRGRRARSSERDEESE